MVRDEEEPASDSQLAVLRLIMLTPSRYELRLRMWGVKQCPPPPVLLQTPASVLQMLQPPPQPWCPHRPHPCTACRLSLSWQRCVRPAGHPEGTPGAPESQRSSVLPGQAPPIPFAHGLLLQVLASLLDMVYRSDEKEKAVPLISRLLYYVFPYLRNHR